MADLSSNTPDPPPGNKAAAVSKAGRRPRRTRETFTLWEWVQIFVVSWIGYVVVLLIGRSLRWEVYGWENWKAAAQRGKGLIYTFWHREIFPATWFWRKRGIVVMSGTNFDAEYTCRIICKHGFGAARGSSTHGGWRALAEMIKRVRKGADAAFTIDGPRGPRYVAKPGSVMLSKATGAAILCFHIALRNAYVFRHTWDKTQIPHPFSRAAIFIAPPIVVSHDARDEEPALKLAEVQKTLDDLRHRGDDWVAGIPKPEPRD